MKNSKINIVGVLLLFLSLICLFIGISYSIFNSFGAGITNNVELFFLIPMLMVEVMVFI